jgi:hypothetical protein
MKQPKFERRHYRAIAAVLRDVAVECGVMQFGANERLMQWTAMKTEMSDMLKADNPRFDRGRFEEACEP